MSVSFQAENKIEDQQKYQNSNLPTFPDQNHILKQENNLKSQRITIFNHKKIEKSKFWIVFCIFS